MICSELFEHMKTRRLHWPSSRYARRRFHLSDCASLVQPLGLHALTFLCRILNFYSQKKWSSLMKDTRSQASTPVAQEGARQTKKHMELMNKWRSMISRARRRPFVNDFLKETPVFSHINAITNYPLPSVAEALLQRT